MQYPEFNTKELYQYIENNPFILEVEKKYRESGDYTLTEFENEYLLKNFKFKPYEFKNLTLEVGKITEKRIQTDFNLERPIKEVTINTIVGETDEWYHVSFRNNDKQTYFWLSKEEVGDLYEKNYSRFPVDFEKLELNFANKSLYDHQKLAVQFLLHNQQCFLMDTVGAGKTYSSIAATIAAECKKVLIICIAGKQIDWRKELKHWNQDSKIIWGESGWIKEKVTYTIIGCDVLQAYHEPAKGKKKGKTPLYDEGYDCVIIDEIQKFRNPKAKKSVVLRALTEHPNVKYVWGMSATAIEKNENFFDICRNINLSVSDLIYTPKDYHFVEWYPKYEEFAKRYCGAFLQNGKAGAKKFLRKLGNTNTYELAQRIRFIQRRRRTESKQLSNR